MQALCLAHAYAAVHHTPLTVVWPPTAASLHAGFRDLFQDVPENATGAPGAAEGGGSQHRGEASRKLPQSVVPAWPEDVDPLFAEGFTVQVRGWWGSAAR